MVSRQFRNYDWCNMTVKARGHGVAFVTYAMLHSCVLLYYVMIPCHLASIVNLPLPASAENRSATHLLVTLHSIGGCITRPQTSQVLPTFAKHQDQPTGLQSSPLIEYFSCSTSILTSCLLWPFWTSISFFSKTASAPAALACTASEGVLAPTKVITPGGMLFKRPFAMSVWKPGRARDSPTERLMPKKGTPMSPSRVTSVLLTTCAMQSQLLLNDGQDHDETHFSCCSD